MPTDSDFDKIPVLLARDTPSEKERKKSRPDISERAVARQLQKIRDDGDKLMERVLALHQQHKEKPVENLNTAPETGIAAGRKSGGYEDLLHEQQQKEFLFREACRSRGETNGQEMARYIFTEEGRRRLEDEFVSPMVKANTHFWVSSNTTRDTALSQMLSPGAIENTNGGSRVLTDRLESGDKWEKYTAERDHLQMYSNSMQFFHHGRIRYPDDVSHYGQNSYDDGFRQGWGAVATENILPDELPWYLRKGD